MGEFKRPNSIVLTLRLKINFLSCKGWKHTVLGCKKFHARFKKPQST